MMHIFILLVSLTAFLTISITLFKDEIKNMFYPEPSAAVLAESYDTDQVPGWPKEFSFANCDGCISSPVLADLDKDGQKEVITAGGDGKIYAFKKDGSNLAGFPVVTDTKERFIGGVTIDDLNNDGSNEIIILAQVYPQKTTKRTNTIKVLKNDGTPFYSWPNPNVYSSVSTFTGNPLSADLDNDGNKEIIYFEYISNNEYKLHVFKLNGTELGSFPKMFAVKNPSEISITDINRDKKPEMMFGSENKLYVLDSQGNTLPGWPYTAPANKGRIIRFEFTPAGADVDGDGHLEVFAMASMMDIVQLYGWRKDGTLLPKWPHEIREGGRGYFTRPALSIADLDNDGKDEVILGNDFELGIHNLYGQKKISNEPIGAKSPVAISDINGDGKLDLITKRTEMRCRTQGGKGTSIDFAVSLTDDGSAKVLWEKKTPVNYCGEPATVAADLDNNGRIELVTTKLNLSLSGKRNYIINVWEMPYASTSLKYDWPMFGRDPARANRLSTGNNIPGTTKTPEPKASTKPLPSPFNPPSYPSTKPDQKIFY